MKVMSDQLDPSRKSLGIVIFDDFTDIDLFLAWDLYNRLSNQLDVKILGRGQTHFSTLGTRVVRHKPLSWTSQADGVLICSGLGTRSCVHDASFIDELWLDPERQLIASQCSGALILAAKGLLTDMSFATTHVNAIVELQSMGVVVKETPFISEGNIAMAGGCFAGCYLAYWMVEKLCGHESAAYMLQSVGPTGEQDEFVNQCRMIVRSSSDKDQREQGGQCA